jgi:predicted SnoaL-like aldol condensation-catalyzing enzyme
MKKRFIYSQLIFGFIVSALAENAIGQVNSATYLIQQSWLSSENPKLAKNKKIAYDFLREVVEAGHLELVEKYMLETYIQHDPNVNTGRQGFIDHFSKFSKPQPIVDSVQAPLIAIVAEGDLVILVYKRELPYPNDPTKKYITTSFDMLRIERGKLAEHWDAATKQ